MSQCSEPPYYDDGRLSSCYFEAAATGTTVIIVVYFVALERDFSDIAPMVRMFGFASYRLMPALQQIFVTAVRFYSSAPENALSNLGVIGMLSLVSTSTLAMSRSAVL